MPRVERLEKQFGAATVGFCVAESVDADQIDPPVAGDGLGQLLFLDGRGQLLTSLVRTEAIPSQHLQSLCSLRYAVATAYRFRPSASAEARHVIIGM